MPPKRFSKKDRKSTKAPDPNKLNKVEKMFCQLEIEAIRNKILHLRSYIIEVKNIKTRNEETLRELNEEPKDRAAELQLAVNNYNNMIVEVQETLTKEFELYEEEHNEGKQAIEDLLRKHSMMRQQLIIELKLLQGKLNALAEYREREKIIMAKTQDQAEKLAQQDINHKEKLAEIRAVEMIEEDIFKYGAKLLLVEKSDEMKKDFNDGDFQYILNIMTENVMFEKKVHYITELIDRMTNFLSDYDSEKRELKLKLNAAETAKRNFIHKIHRTNIEISKLAMELENITEKCKRMSQFRKHFEQHSDTLQCEDIEFIALEKKLNQIRAKLVNLKIEKNHLVIKKNIKTTLIRQLHDIINGCKYIIFNLIGFPPQNVDDTFVASLKKKLARSVNIASTTAVQSKRLTLKSDDIAIKELTSATTESAITAITATATTTVTKSSSTSASTSETITTTDLYSKLSKVLKIDIAPIITPSTVTPISSKSDDDYFDFMVEPKPDLIELFKYDAKAISLIRKSIIMERQEPLTPILSKSTITKSTVELSSDDNLYNIKPGSSMYASSERQILDVVPVEEEPIEEEVEDDSSDYNAEVKRVSEKKQEEVEEQKRISKSATTKIEVVKPENEVPKEELLAEVEFTDEFEVEEEVEEEEFIPEMFY